VSLAPPARQAHHITARNILIACRRGSSLRCDASRCFLWTGSHPAVRLLRSIYHFFHVPDHLELARKFGCIATPCL
jgi:hypothetical protein